MRIHNTQLSLWILMVSVQSLFNKMVFQEITQRAVADFLVD